MLSAHHLVPESRRRSATAALLALCLFAAGCATSGALHPGDQAESRQDYDLAVGEYTKAARRSPDVTTARVSLERAMWRASQEHSPRGRRLAAVGKLDQALIDYQVAS